MSNPETQPSIAIIVAESFDKVYALTVDHAILIVRDKLWDTFPETCKELIEQLQSLKK